MQRVMIFHYSHTDPASKKQKEKLIRLIRLKGIISKNEVRAAIVRSGPLIVQTTIKQ